jgi:hypothetical protein
LPAGFGFLICFRRQCVFFKRTACVLFAAPPHGGYARRKTFDLDPTVSTP